MLAWVVSLIVMLTASGVGAAETAVVAPAMTAESFVYDGHDQRDPFTPLVTAGGAIVMIETSYTVAEMVLEGVITSGGSDGPGGIAIINGTVVEQGKMFGAYTVDKVEAGQVTLQKDGQVSVLRIKKEE
jgi:hypothetical protein